MKSIINKIKYGMIGLGLLGILTFSGCNKKVELRNEYNQIEDVYIYNSKKELIERQYFENGSVYQIIEYEKGKRKKVKEDTNGDGILDNFVYYDSNENVKRVEKDIDDDGKIDIME